MADGAAAAARAEPSTRGDVEPSDARPPSSVNFYFSLGPRAPLGRRMRRALGAFATSVPRARAATAVDDLLVFGTPPP